MSKELIEAIRLNPGDQSAWARWFKTCYSRLYYVLYRKTGGDVARSQDLAQEAMLRFVRYRGYEKTETDQAAVAYLIRTALNVLVSERTLPPTVDWPVEQIEDPSETTQAIEKSSDLERILGAMSKDEQDVLRMAIKGQTITDIASQLGIRNTTAASRVHRAKEKAKEIAQILQKNA